MVVKYKQGGVEMAEEMAGVTRIVAVGTQERKKQWHWRHSINEGP